MTTFTLVAGLTAIQGGSGLSVMRKIGGLMKRGYANFYKVVDLQSSWQANEEEFVLGIILGY